MRPQPTFALSLLFLFSMSLSFLLLVQLHVNPAASQMPTSSADKQDPFAEIKTMVLDGAKLDKADPPAATIVHKGMISGARPGMMLYVGDEVTTGAKIKLTILFLDKAAENNNEVVIDEKTHVQIGSLFTWGGRVLASLKGYFKTKTRTAQWGVEGTEYELLVDEKTGATRLRVLKGAVRVERGTYGPTFAENEENDRLETWPMFLRAAYREPVTSLQQKSMEFVAVSGKVTDIDREFILTNSCQGRHLFKVASPLNLNWFQFLGADQFAIDGKGTRTIRFAIRLDGTNVPGGIQQSQIIFPCLDCNAEPGCGISGLLLPITVNVLGNSPSPTPTATALPTATEQPTASIEESEGSDIAARMEEITLPPAGRLQKSPASVQGVDETLNWSNEVIIPGEPTYSAQSVVPRFRTAEERNRVFREVRRSSIINDDQRSKETLADVYVDWGNGAKAEEELKRLGLSSQETPERLTTLGESYRLMGDLRRAEELLQRAIRLNSNWAPAFNALGNVYLDQAKVEQDKRNYDAARGYLERAKAEYAKALNAKPSSSPDEQNHARSQQPSVATPEKTQTVAHSNIGEVYLRLGAIARDEGNRDEAFKQFQVAEQAFGNAAKTDQSYQFAFSGLGDVYRETGETLTSQGDNARADQYFVKSKDNYAQAVNLHSDMAEAYVGLGRVFDDTGQHREALNYYIKATQVRPELPDPHYHLAVALAPIDPQKAAEQARAYLKIEREILKQGKKANDAERIKDGLPPTSPTPIPTSTHPPTPTPTVPLTPTPTPTPTGPPVKIPDIKGNRSDAALAELTKKKLVGKVSDQRDCEATGKVLSTEPRIGQMVPAGSTITVYVSAAGENAVTMPPLKRSDQKAAEEQLRRLDLHPNIKTRETDRDAPYTVIGQKPDAGKQIPAGCSVELTVAIPIPPVTVPRYVGRNVRYIFAAIDGLRLGNVVEVDSEQPGGTVLRQSPQPGEVVPRGTAINLEVSVSLVYVPDVMQNSMNDAVKKIRDAGLNPVIVGQPGPQSFVGKQDPPGGTRVRRGSPVRLWPQVIDGR